MNISIHDWQEVDIQEIAQLTYEVLQHSSATRYKQTLEGITHWFNTLTFDEPFTGSPVIVLAHEERNLIGWLMLCNTGSKTAEAVPWELEIRPIISPECDRTDVMAQLLEKAVTWAEKEGVEVILLRVDKELGQEYEPVRDVTWFESLGFTVREDTVYMDYYITGYEKDADLPEDFKLQQIKEVDTDDLYQCYYDTFSAGQSPFFFDQKEDEKRETFDLLFETRCVHEDTSLAIVKDSKIVGFSFAKPGIKGNVLLEWIGIHPDYRRRGLGEFLLRHIMKKVSEQGYTTMSLSCAVENTRASSLYRKCGWDVEGGETIFSLRI